MKKSPVDRAHAALAAASQTAMTTGSATPLLELAQRLLRHGRLVTKKTVFRFAELEVYAHTKGHEDPFAHCDERQLYNGGLYFHRVGDRGDSNYKGGSYKGMDVSVGGGLDSKCYVGILVRALEIESEEEDEESEWIEGPSLVVDALLEAVGFSSIQDYVASLNGEQLLGDHMPAACASSAPIAVHLMDDTDSTEHHAVMATARVGLTLKKVKQDDDEVDACEAPHFQYILSPYRLLRSPEKFNKGRTYIVCALLLQHKLLESSVPAIAEASGTKPAIVEKYRKDMQAGKELCKKAEKKARESFLGTGFNARELCKLHGALWNVLEDQFVAVEDSQDDGASKEDSKPPAIETTAGSVTHAEEDPMEEDPVEEDSKPSAVPMEVDHEPAADPIDESAPPVAEPVAPPVTLEEAFVLSAEGAKTGSPAASLGMARTLVTRGSFVVTNPSSGVVTRFHFMETELFANISNNDNTVVHHDPFAHADPRQAYTGALYFHRAGKGEDSYKGGTYKGMDIAAGDGENCCVGILVRSMERESDGAIFEGPSLVVDALLQAVGAESITAYVATLSGDQLLAHKVPSACAPSAPIRITLLEHGSHPGEVVAAARSGLSLKKSTSINDAQFQYVISPYRLIRRARDLKKGRLWAICSQLVETELDHSTIAESVGAKESVVGKYWNQIENGKNAASASGTAAALQHFVGSALNTNQVCELFGVLWKQLKERTGQALPATKVAPGKKRKSKAPTGGRWQYYLNVSIHGKTAGWHDYDATASAKLDTKWSEQMNVAVLHRTTWHLKSGYYSYEVNLGTMTQRNMETGKVRPIRRFGGGAKLVAADSDPPEAKKPKVAPATKKVKADAETKKPKATFALKEPEEPGEPSEPEAADPLKLKTLFQGQHGHTWEKSMLSAIYDECGEDSAAVFVGPSRDKSIIPVRELTFQALKPNPPEAWRVLTFGQSPYPRIESATGIAHFDNLIDSWDSKAFGRAASMRCMIKAAAIHKYGIAADTPVSTLRAQLNGSWDAVTPPQWFEAMLTQGVLLLNAALTLGGDGMSKDKHVKFWQPVVKRVVREILEAKTRLPKGDTNRGVLMLWWGADSLKVKKMLEPLFAEFGGQNLTIDHIQHANPAAQGELFCKGDHFTDVNGALTKRGQPPVDWLPTKSWLASNVMAEHSAFISETQDLHKMYLERLQDGLQRSLVEIKPIVGVMASPLLPLPEAVTPIKGSLRQVATAAVTSASKLKAGEGLNENEKGAIYLYTGNSLYSGLNAALRDANRSLSKPYFQYLRIFLEGYEKLKASLSADDEAKPMMLYRGIRKDLTGEYQQGSVATWWSISSCTPKLSVAQSFGGGSANGTLFEIRSLTAIPVMQLSAYQGEEEYILSPGTRLKVAKVTKKHGGANVIYLEELPGEKLVT